MWTEITWRVDPYKGRVWQKRANVPLHTCTFILCSVMLMLLAYSQHKQHVRQSPDQLNWHLASIPPDSIGRAYIRGYGTISFDASTKETAIRWSQGQRIEHLALMLLPSCLHCQCCCRAQCRGLGSVSSSQRRKGWAGLAVMWGPVLVSVHQHIERTIRQLQWHRPLEPHLHQMH